MAYTIIDTMHIGTTQYQHLENNLATKTAKKSFQFESALAELEKLVEQMEQGELSLEDSLKHFERGVALTRSCQNALKDAEQKVQILLKENQHLTTKIFQSEE